MRRATRFDTGRSLVGQRVNNVVIRRLLAEGGMGAVYEARHPTLGKRVAVKVLRPDLALDSAAVQRFFNEARAAGSIRHPNIVEVVGLGLLPEGVPYMMMELLEGESLADRLARETRLPVDGAVDLAIQIALGLEAAHRAGVVHRDLKPENVFLVPGAQGEQVKLLDFGIAKLLGDLSVISVATVAGTVFGTPPYMSPEQCRGQGEFDHRSDIYALGVILYEILCGKPPFTGTGLGDVMMMHLTTEPLSPSAHRPEIPPALERIILRALAKQPADRFASMAVLAEALAATRSAPIAAPVTRPRHARLRSRVLLGAGACGLLLLAASAVQLARNGRGARIDLAQPAPARPDVTAIARPALPPQIVEPVAARATRGRLPGREPIRRAAARRRVVPVAAGPEAISGDQAPGYLSLDSAPWANVSLGDRQLGSTPLVRAALPPGRHTLKLTNPERGTVRSYVVEIRSGAAISRFVGF